MQWAVIPILGISVRQPEQVQIENVYNLAVKTAAQLTDKPLSRDNVIDDGYVGEGYGIPTETMVAATRMLARNEGILLDPKNRRKRNGVDWSDTVRSDLDEMPEMSFFLHTGGSVSLFAKEEQFITQR